MSWSYGDWHEDMVALYDDSNDRMVCWLQKQGGVDAKALGLIKAAPELLAALKLLRDPDGVGRWPCYCNEPHFDGGKCENCIATAAIDKAEGSSE